MREHTPTPPTDKRGKHKAYNKTDEVKLNGVRSFINKFPSYESHYSRHKSSNRKYLAPDLSLNKLFELYKSETQSPVSYFVFSRTFNTEFNLLFHAPVTDSCKCDIFSNKIKSLTDPNDKRSIQIERELHQRKAECAREGLRFDASLAKENPNILILLLALLLTL